jgi:hypothetical protein
MEDSLMYRFGERMRKGLVIPLFLIFIINLLAITITNAPTGTTVAVDPNLIQDDTMKPGAPDINSYPSTHANTATVTNPANAYDKNQGTYAVVTPAAATTLWYSFDVKVFNSTLLKSYSYIDIQMKYSVLVYRAYYKISLYVGTAYTILQYQSNTNVTTPTLKTWTAIEPNDGAWSAADLNNLIIRVEVKRQSTTGTMSCNFNEYETWAAIQGDSFTFRVNVADVPASPNGTVAWQINITFNPLILQCTTVYEGPFLKQAGLTYFYVVIDNATGYVLVGSALQTFDLGGVAGSGVLATFAFKVANQGNSALSFIEGTNLRSWNGTQVVPISFTSFDGYFRSIQGDTNGDLHVNALDLYKLGKAYGSTYGPPPSSNWNVNCDFNKDNVINSADLTVLKNNYGRS